jgi:GNAT superfamily N-acetyltransferase
VDAALAAGAGQGGGRVIRGLQDEDVAGLAVLERSLLPPELFVTERGLRHDLQTFPARARQRTWVAVEDGVVTGWARALFRWGHAEPGAARIGGGVRLDRRGRGLGAALYEEAVTHLREHGGTTVYAETLGDAGERFLRARGFETIATEHYSAIDPASTDLAGLDRLEAERAAEGFVLAPLRELRDRPRDVWELDSAAKLDVPCVAPRVRLPYEDWRPEAFEHPDLDDDGSQIVLHGDRPVAYAFISADRTAGRAVNGMTGTLPGYRRRGLARLAKLGTLRWAREAGIRSIWTGNDAENAGMLALNDELGYRRFLTTVELIKRL